MKGDLGDGKSVLLKVRVGWDIAETAGGWGIYLTANGRPGPKPFAVVTSEDPNRARQLAALLMVSLATAQTRHKAES